MKTSRRRGEEAEERGNKRSQREKEKNRENVKIIKKEYEENIERRKMKNA